MISIKICQPLEAKLTNLKLSKMVFHVVFLCQKCAKVQFWAFDSPKVEKTRGNHNGPLPLRRKFIFKLVFSQTNLLQGVFYGVIICGFRNLRVLFGPLPVSICNLEYLLTKILMWFALFIILGKGF